jgi:hypothetical protein
MGGLQWFDNMKLPDWGSFADEYSDSSCYYHFCGQMQSSPRSRLTNATFASEDEIVTVTVQVIGIQVFANWKHHQLRNI